MSKPENTSPITAMEDILKKNAILQCELIKKNKLIEALSSELFRLTLRHNKEIKKKVLPSTDESIESTPEVNNQSDDGLVTVVKRSRLRSKSRLQKRQESLPCTSAQAIQSDDQATSE